MVLVDSIKTIKPDWDVPANVKALVALRTGGVSESIYKGLNLGDHVEDDPERVKSNRALLKEDQQLPSEPIWLNQTHSTKVIKLPDNTLTKTTEADASWTADKNIICTILTADCLPVFFYHVKEQKVGLAHAGWRGLAGGILEKMIQEMTLKPEFLKVWLGPAISQTYFEVGQEVREAFLKADKLSDDCFTPVNYKPDHYHADLYALAKYRLHRVGVRDITGGQYCTYREKNKFYSYRRDGQTGRMANMIWMSDI